MSPRTFEAAVLLLAAVAGAPACSLEERSDFLVGRACSPERRESCDEAEACLPHALVGGRMEDFRCRDRASFEPVGGREPPLAYCDERLGVACPADLVCNADRVRLDVSERPLVCKFPDDVFSPPLDGGL